MTAACCATGGTCAIAIDIPIGVLERSCQCDQTMRSLLGQQRGCSVFSPPCRAALQANTYEQGCTANELCTGRRLSRQAWGIARKIRAVDEAISPAAQYWVFEAHPEVSFWALNDRRSMVYRGKLPPVGTNA